MITFGKLTKNDDQIIREHFQTIFKNDDFGLSMFSAEEDLQYIKIMTDQRLNKEILNHINIFYDVLKESNQFDQLEIYRSGTGLTIYFFKKA